jgi:hypothetical protein
MQLSDLVRFDPTLNCFVLRDPMQNHPSTWPDGTPKSTNNAFNWRSGVADTAFLKPKAANGRSKDLNSNGNVYAFSRASIERVPYGRSKKFKDFGAKI